MDYSIKLATPEVHQERGTQAYYNGVALGAHGLTDRAAIKQWEYGWHIGRVAQKHAGEQLEAA
jgi:hypothetical protein